VSSVRLALREGCYMASLDLKDAYWHVPINKAFRPFLAFSAGGLMYQFRVMPFGLNIAPRVFTRILRPVHQALAREGVQVLMYLDDWLIFASTFPECEAMVRRTLEIGRGMGLLFNLEKSHLLPSRCIQWLGMSWDSVSCRLSLSEDNRARCRRKLFRNAHAISISLRQWESLLGSLNHAAQVVPLGRLRARRLILSGLRRFQSTDRDSLVPFPGHLRRRLWWWLEEDRLGSWAAWTGPDPFLTLTTDASNSGWGYQSSMGHQGAGVWDSLQSRWHINVKELQTVYLALLQEPSLRQGSIRVQTDNMATVHCINKQGSVKSSSLLWASESLLEEAHRRGLSLHATFLAGVQNTWADALSRGSTSSIEWSLTPACFDALQDWAGCPTIDLFASHLNHQLPLFLTRTRMTQSGGPDAFTEDWNRWSFIYLFPPPTTPTMLRVLRLLEVFRGQAILIAPLWETQPWFPALSRLRPRSLPLPLDSLRQGYPSEFRTSLRLTAWHFFGGP
ncbi:MAG: reverse transcriptase domain-containing protein, partial [Cyanobacteria bacterium J06553_1]